MAKGVSFLAGPGARSMSLGVQAVDQENITLALAASLLVGDSCPVHRVQ